MKGNALNFRETVTMILATGMMYGGATFVLVFDNPVLGFSAAALNFCFWTWVAAFFVLFGKDTVFGRMSFGTRLLISLTFLLAFVSSRYDGWFKDQLRKLDNSSCTFLGEGI